MAEEIKEEKTEEVEGHDAAFMGDAPGAKVQSCVPTLKVAAEEQVNTFIPMPPM